MKIMVHETLSAEARIAAFVESGAEPPTSQVTEVDAATLSAEVRRALLSCVEGVFTHLRERGDGASGARPVRVLSSSVSLRSIEVSEYGRTDGLAQRILDAAAYAPDAKAEHEAAEAAAAAEREAKRARDEAYRAAYREEEAAKEAAKEARKAAVWASRAAWIAEHGSERLRLAAQVVGIDKCRGIYRDERLAQLSAKSGLAWQYDIEASRHEDAINPLLAALQLHEQVARAASSWGLDADFAPTMIFVRDGGDGYSEQVVTLAYLDNERVIVGAED